MREEGLFLRIKSRQKYSSYKGEIPPEVPNLVQLIIPGDQPMR